MFEGLIFDFDNTIAQNNDTSDNDILSILESFGAIIDQNTLPFIQRATSDYTICKRFLHEDDIELAYKSILEINCQKVLNASYSLSLLKILEELAGEYRLFIVSGRDQHSLELALKNAKIDSLFETVMGDDKSLNPKPHPAALIKLARQKDLNLANCLYIGDKLTDYEFACAAACNFLGATWYNDSLTMKNQTCNDVMKLTASIEYQFNVLKIS